jgi:hypothetical protein
MSQFLNITRQYNFPDGQPLIPSQIDAEFKTIVDQLNNIFRRGFRSYGSSFDTAFKFYNSSDTQLTQVGYLIDNFVIIGDSVNGLNLTTNGASIALGTTSGNYGGGKGLIYIFQASVEPSSDPTLGGLLWTYDGALRYRGTEGSMLTLAPKGVGNIVFADSPWNIPIAINQVFANAASGAITVNLPLAASNEGRTVFIKKIDGSANAVTVSTVASDDIEGSSTYSLPTQFKSVTLVSQGGVRWYIQSAT